MRKFAGGWRQPQSNAENQTTLEGHSHHHYAAVVPRQTESPEEGGGGSMSFAGGGVLSTPTGGDCAPARDGGVGSIPARQHPSFPTPGRAEAVPALRYPPKFLLRVHTANCDDPGRGDQFAGGGVEYTTTQKREGMERSRESREGRDSRRVLGGTILRPGKPCSGENPDRQHSNSSDLDYPGPHPGVSWDGEKSDQHIAKGTSGVAAARPENAPNSAQIRPGNNFGGGGVDGDTLQPASTVPGMSRRKRVIARKGVSLFANWG